MSIRARLSRAVKGKSLPDIYPDLLEQEARIISDIENSLTEAKVSRCVIPKTRKEWDRLRQDSTFKNEASPEFICSFDAFVEEFGTCARDKPRLRKTNHKHVTWNKHNTEWSRWRR